MVLMAVLFFEHDHHVVCVIYAHEIFKRRDKEPYSNPRLTGETNEMWYNPFDPNRHRYTGVFKMIQNNGLTLLIPTAAVTGVFREIPKMRSNLLTPAATSTGAFAARRQTRSNPLHPNRNRYRRLQGEKINAV